MAHQSYAADRRALVEAAFRGESTPRPLLALWRHWPEQDQDFAALAEAHVDFQRRYDFDFVKFTPSGTDVVEDWGVETRFSGDPHGTRDIVRRPIGSPDDWAGIQPRDLLRSRLGGHLEAIATIRRQLGGVVPIFQTVFSPLTIARKLGGDRVATDLREHPARIHAVLETIVEDQTRFLERSFDVGADGLFFATQAATRDLLDDEEHRTFGVAYDRRLLEVARSRTSLVIGHAHGSNLMFDQLLTYPVPALNWHDRAVGPSIAQMRGRFQGLLVAGVDEWGALLEGPAEAIKAQMQDAVDQAAGRPLCLAAGCVIGYRTPDRHIRSARRFVEEIGGR